MSIDKCPECGEEYFRCPYCGSQIKIYDLVDIFHVGFCETCRTQHDELCSERVK